MKKCKHCGSENYDTAIKCDHCGSRNFEKDKIEVKGWKGMTTLQKFSILLLLLSLVYLASPWDILPFSFFDDLALVLIAFGIWVIAIVGGERH